MDSNTINKINNMLDEENNKNNNSNVKIIKKDRSLYERTNVKTTLITEDNKMVLND